MFNFPDGLYSDVRIEHRRETIFRWRDGSPVQHQVRNDETAFIRIFDGRRWYYSGTAGTGHIQKAIDYLAAMAVRSNLRGNPLVDAFKVNRGEFGKVPDLPDPVPEKRKALEGNLIPRFQLPEGVYYDLCYEDRHATRRIISSKGTDLTVDSGGAGYRFRFSFDVNGHRMSSNLMDHSGTFQSLLPEKDHVSRFVDKCLDYNLHAVPLPSGPYTVILSPVCAGLFAHESFGHRSEADFMKGHEAMMMKWPIGSRVASELLSVTDDGSSPGPGRIFVDDEGTVCGRTWLLRDGILSGRLHSVDTASHFGEKPTGNARAVNCGYEPIVRMTNTCIAPGTTDVGDLFKDVEDGLFVETIRGGTGLDRFTLNPGLAWRIRSGKLAEPVKVSLLAGEPGRTLFMVDGVSNSCTMSGSVDGGCGKFSQNGLRVGFGGPFVRVKRMEVI